MTTTESEIRFELGATPPSKGTGRISSKYGHLLTVLSENRGEWAKVECESAGQAANRAALLKRREGVEAVTRGSDLYVRKV